MECFRHNHEPETSLASLGGVFRPTASQTRLTPGERRGNVSNAFRVASDTREALRSAHVVLVDDVVTTAATLNACAAALCAGGVRIVSYLTFARAPADGDRR